MTGIVCALLASAGNPGNSGLCMTGFMRDSAGALLGAPAWLATASYIRPELIGMVVGAGVVGRLSGEHRPSGGASPVTRFLLGVALGLAAMVFIGCTVRVWLRVGGGDLSALPGAAGLIGGIALGVVLMRSGFHLGQASETSRTVAAGAQATALLLLVPAAMLASGLRPPMVAQTAAGVVPGGLRAPFLFSLAGGLAIGGVAQRTRFCGVSGIRDSMLLRKAGPLLGVLGLLAGTFAANLLLGRFVLGYHGQPLAQPDWVGSVVSMGAVGLSATLLGGCPFRQVVMAATGDVDAGMAVLGMISGVVGAHALGTVSSPAGVAPNSWILLAAVWAALLTIAIRKGAAVPVAISGRRDA